MLSVITKEFLLFFIFFFITLLLQWGAVEKDSSYHPVVIATTQEGDEFLKVNARLPYCLNQTVIEVTPINKYSGSFHKIKNPGLLITSPGRL